MKELVCLITPLAEVIFYYIDEKEVDDFITRETDNGNIVSIVSNAEPENGIACFEVVEEV